MANAFYKKGLKSFLDGDINLLSNDIRVALVDTESYVADFTSDQFLDAIPSGDIIAVSPALTGKLTTSGLFKADNAIFTGTSGDDFEAFVLYKHTGSSATARLILYVDTGYTTLPMTPGGVIILQWPVAGIFDLGT